MYLQRDRSVYSLQGYELFVFYNILYFVPGLQILFNLQDHSYSLTPELIYTGLDDLELRLRATAPIGEELTEWGEKPNEYKLEFRLRYYF